MDRRGTVLRRFGLVVALTIEAEAVECAEPVVFVERVPVHQERGMAVPLAVDRAQQPLDLGLRRLVDRL